ncbi:MAG TPA: BON domain-containing protein [Terriglobales bacterium]|nr:BON domain-containing protein [Terriglobales bacterium]
MQRGGCLFSTALLAALLAAGCARPHNDAQVASEAQAKIYGDPSVHTRKITIQSNNGILTLNGFVSSDPERLSAAADAATIAGVKTVVNNLQVTPSQEVQAVADPRPTGEQNPLPSSSTPASRSGLQPVPSQPHAPASSTTPPQIQKAAARPKAKLAIQNDLAGKADRGTIRAATQTKTAPGSGLPYSVAAAPPSSPVGAAQPPVPSVMPSSMPARTASTASPAPAAASPSMPKPAAVTASAAPASATPATTTAAPVRLPQPRPITIPAGTNITVRLLDEVDSGRNHPGDSFRATLDAALLDASGATVVPAGYELTGRIVDAKSAGRFAGSSALALQLTQVSVNGRQYDLETNQYTRRGKSRGKSTAEKVGGGAALGAVLGGLLGGAKGAAIGATMGAGAGTGVSAAGKGEQIVLRPETVLNFELRSPISVIPAAQSPHGARLEGGSTASMTGASNPGVPSNTGEDGPPVLKRRGH